MKPSGRAGVGDRSDGRTRSTILKVKIRTKSMTDPSYHVSSYHVFMRRRRGIDASVVVRRGAFTAAAAVDSGAVRAVSDAGVGVVLLVVLLVIVGVGGVRVADGGLGAVPVGGGGGGGIGGTVGAALSSA